MDMIKFTLENLKTFFVNDLEKETSKFVNEFEVSKSFKDINLLQIPSSEQIVPRNKVKLQAKVYKQFLLESFKDRFDDMASFQVFDILQCDRILKIKEEKER